MADGSAKYEYKYFSIEHVLPQTPKADSQWKKTWTDNERKLWLNKIGNLIPLNIRTNSSVRNSDFKEKKKNMSRMIMMLFLMLLQQIY